MNGNELAAMLLALKSVGDRKPGVEEAMEAIANAMTAIADAANAEAKFKEHQELANLRTAQALVKQ